MIFFLLFPYIPPSIIPSNFSHIIEGGQGGYNDKNKTKTNFFLRSTSRAELLPFGSVSKFIFLISFHIFRRILYVQDFSSQIPIFRRTFTSNLFKSNFNFHMFKKPPQGCNFKKTTWGRKASARLQTKDHLRP